MTALKAHRAVLCCACSAPKTRPAARGQPSQASVNMHGVCPVRPCPHVQGTLCALPPTWLHPSTHPHPHTSLTLTVSSSLPLMSSAPLLLAARQLTAALCSSRWLASTPRGRQDGLLPAPAGPAPLEPGPPSSPADPARCWPIPVVMAALTASYTEPDGSPATRGATRTHTTHTTGTTRQVQRKVVKSRPLQRCGSKANKPVWWSTVPRMHCPAPNPHTPFLPSCLLSVAPCPAGPTPPEGPALLVMAAILWVSRAAGQRTSWPA